MRACLIVALLLMQGLAAAATDNANGDNASGDSAPEAAGTTIYRTTDADGNVVFTDNPSRDRPSKAVKLKPTNSMPMGASQDEKAAPGDNNQTAESAFQGYTDLRITSPEDGATIRNPQKPVAVKAQVTPPLQPGNVLRILDNGKPLQGQGLDHPDRGTHTLEAQVVNKAGDVLIRSPSITVYVHRTSVSEQSHNQSGSGSGMASYGSAASAGSGASYGDAAQAGGAAGMGSAASFGHAASVATPATPAK